jgi:hypothetical protein
MPKRLVSSAVLLFWTLTSLVLTMFGETCVRFPHHVTAYSLSSIHFQLYGSWIEQVILMEYDVTLLDKRFPTFRRKCYPSKRREPLTQWCDIISQKSCKNLKTCTLHRFAHAFFKKMPQKKSPRMLGPVILVATVLLKWSCLCNTMLWHDFKLITLYVRARIEASRLPRTEPEVTSRFTSLLTVQHYCLVPLRFRVLFSGQRHTTLAEISGGFPQSL